MTPTKIKKPKKEKKPPFPVYPIENWSVNNYGIRLYCNTIPTEYKDGISLDVEDNEQGAFVGLGLCTGDACYYWSDRDIIKQLIIPKFVAHNGVSDLRKLQKWGFKVDESSLLWDTMLYAHILDSTRKRYGLKELVIDIGVKYPTYEDVTGKGKAHTTLDKLPLELVANYNSMDCLATYKLYEKQKAELQKSDLNYFSILEKPVSFLFNKMSERGIQVDLPYLKALKETLEGQRRPLAEVIAADLGPINLNSPKQLLGALNAKGVNPQLKGKPSTDKRALEKYRNNPTVSNLLQYSELDTLLSSFVNPYLERNEGVVHPQFKQTGTRTGRPSCANPNLLQIPKRTKNGKLVRRMFVARDRCLFGDCDYNEGEPRMLAHLSQDPAMCQLFSNDEGFHSYFAKHLNISRDRAKVFDLETYYRATKHGVARHLNCGLEEAQQRIDEAWALFPTLYDWEQRIIREAKNRGYITTLMGRRIKIDDLDNTNSFIDKKTGERVYWIRDSAERQAMNNLAQASLQECMKVAMIEIDKAGIDILVQVYDEVLFESPEESISQDVEIVIDKMCNTTKLSIPMKVDSKIGKTWSDCK